MLKIDDHRFLGLCIQTAIIDPRFRALPVPHESGQTALPDSQFPDGLYRFIAGFGHAAMGQHARDARRWRMVALDHTGADPGHLPHLNDGQRLSSDCSERLV
ncbi:hypothetical protein [Mesorhizobium sp.]|uniref:hypothetical protein n=1 Tax=Mesorhizobium sp. TaxID=1871066 RepID=UPI00257D5519|nr:hypothetical protein [Mesorhizobium sp.]